MNSLQPLIQDNIILRAPETNDITLMYAIENDARLWLETNSTSQPISRHFLSAYLASSHNDIYTDCQLRLVAEVEGSSIGLVDLFDFSPRHLRAEVGIGLASQFRGKGYGKIILQILERYVSETLFIHQIYAHVAESNIAAINLFTKSNYEIVGKLKEWTKIGKEYESVYLFQKIFQKK